MKVKTLVTQNTIIDGTSNDEIFYYFARNEKDRAAIDEVIKMYPVRITSFLKSLLKNSPALCKQFLPNPQEINTEGTSTPFEEGKKSSELYGLEQLYRDRVLITPNFNCPAFCRFCYKKSRVMRNKRDMTYEDIDLLIAELKKRKMVRGALITGGEPMMNQNILFYLLDQLQTLDHITEIRIGTRSLLTMPEIYTDEFCNKIASYIKPDFTDPKKSKYLAINVHFNHPDELVPEVIKAANKLTSLGVTLRNQTVLLKGINDDEETIKELFSILIRNNMIPYYFNHCMPVAGSDQLRTSVAKGLEIYQHLCTESSTIIPHYVYAPSGGKVHVGPDTKLKYIDGEKKKIEVKMLYKANEFKTITNKPLPPFHEETEDGFIKGIYLNGTDN